MSLCQDSHGSVVPIGNTLILSGWFTNLPGTGVPQQEVAICNPTIFIKYPNVLDTEVTRLLELGAISEMGQVQVCMLIHTLQFLILRKTWLLESIPGKFNNYVLHIYSLEELKQEMVPESLHGGGLFFLLVPMVSRIRIFFLGSEIMKYYMMGKFTLTYNVI